MILYRSIFAGNLLLACLLVTAHGLPADITASATPPSISDSKRDDVRFAQLSPTVWKHTSMKEVPAFGLVPANGLLVIDDDYSILIGTAWTDDQTASIPNWARLTLKEAGKTGSLYLCTRRQNGRVGIVQKRDVQTYALALSN